jgi:hypothetical protein
MARQPGEQTDLARLMTDDDLSPPQRGGGPSPYHEAAALVGVEIDPQKLLRTESVRSCSCPEDRGTDALKHNPNEADPWQYCPWCAKALYEDRVVTIEAWDSSDPDRPVIAGLSVVATASPNSPGLERTELGRDVIRRGVRLFAGEIVVRTDFASHARLAGVSPEMLSDAKARVRARLEPLGLWDERTFGLWAVLHVVR